MFEKRKEEEELPGCLFERRFDNILFSRKRKKDCKYLEYERILTHTTLSYHARTKVCYRVFDACYICPIMSKDQIIRLASVFEIFDIFIYLDYQNSKHCNLGQLVSFVMMYLLHPFDQIGIQFIRMNVE